MIGYITKRILSLVPVMFVVAIVVFFIVHLSPGEPASVILGPNASQSEVEALRAELGHDDPVPVQFFNWLGDAVTGDLGESIYANAPVTEVFGQYFIPTLSLTIFAQILAVVFAIPVGIIAAIRKGTAVDQSLMGFSLLGISIPSFLLGLFLILLFSVNLEWFPVAGFVPLSEGIWPHIRSLILPAIALSLAQAALLVRMTRSSMLDILDNEYIKAARSKGLKERVVIYKHALRNAFVTILEVIGQTFSTLIAGAVVIEFVFNIPGIGQLIVNSVERRDFPVIQGTILLIALLYVFINLAIDLLYGVVDPRVRFGKKGD
ncbi:ABC transporter permease [Allobacillus sp. GCM10007491]|uniref:ABC transporter permease n=1 Tax=Allobacillus saliphilus TaxID=2912308 RepID=A0A941CSW8_9BACI|nr:ABC transporter permease [Allobacillus saliphilus]MBR7552531.1 ABC transporter permease [Allobacillus saliphilus]